MQRIAESEIKEGSELSKNPRGRVQRVLPLCEWELDIRASSEARKVEAVAAGSARRVSTLFYHNAIDFNP